MECISVLYLEITENVQFRVMGVYLFIFYETSANNGLQPLYQWSVINVESWQFYL